MVENIQRFLSSRKEKRRSETIFLVGVEVFKKNPIREEERMKKKVAYMTIAILVLLISVVRIFSEPDKNPFEAQPATHLVG